MPEDFKNILIIKPSALGDIVLALPALSALRRNFPDAKISWLIRPEFAPLLKDHPHLDEILIFDRVLLGKAHFSIRAFRALISLIRRLRKTHFDAVIDLQGLFRTASLGWLSGCKKRFGMANARELAILFYTSTVPLSSEWIHVVDHYLKIVQAMGASELQVEFVLPRNLDAEDSAAELLRGHGIEADDYIVFVPGSTDHNKRWPTDRFAILADRISSQFHLPIIATGSAFESDTIERLRSLAETRIINLAGRTSLAELVALLRSAKLVVSNDTGPGHIAAALGTPLVMMYSWSNPARIAPYGRDECMVAREPYGRGLKIKSTDPKHSVKTITVDEVYQKACEQLYS